MAEYKIRDIEALTGIKAHTIRIWEKRYGILVPDRTASKIRTYSEADLMLLLNVSILNQNGIKISKIAQMSVTELKDKVRAASFSKESESAVLSLLIGGLIEFDAVLIRRILQSIILKEGVRACYLNYILPFLDRIGVMWLVGSITPAQEHFVSNLIREMLIVETSKLVVPIKPKKTYVLFCREGDWHELSLLFYNYLLIEKGHQTVYLGQSLPLDKLELIGDKTNLTAFVTSLISPLDDKAQKDMIRFINKTTHPVYLGGGQAKTILQNAHTAVQVEDVRTLFV